MADQGRITMLETKAQYYLNSYQELKDLKDSGQWSDLDEKNLKKLLREIEKLKEKLADAGGSPLMEKMVLILSENGAS